MGPTVGVSKFLGRSDSDDTTHDKHADAARRRGQDDSIGRVE